MGEKKEPRPLSETDSILFDLNASVFDLNVEDTMSWDNISMGLQGKTFSTVEDFKTEFLKELDSVYWKDQGFSKNIRSLLESKVATAKGQSQKK